MGRRLKIVVLFGTAIARGKFAQLNVTIGAARGRVEIRGSNGILPSLAHRVRDCQAHYVYWDTAARSLNHCCRGKN